MQRSKKAERALLQVFNTCSYCFRQMRLEYGHPDSVTFDHVIPKSAGGRSEVAACYQCNMEKADRPLLEFLDEKHQGNMAVISAIFQTVTSSVREGERIELANQRQGKYNDIPIGSLNNFKPLSQPGGKVDMMTCGRLVPEYKQLPLF